MKRILSILIVLLLCISVFAGCEKPDDDNQISLNDEDIHTDYAGVYLTLTSVDDSGEYKKLKTIWHNETNKEVVYGEYYQIEKYEKDTDEWKSVLTTDFAVEDIGLILPADSEQEKSYSLKCFDVSKEGTYRLRCEFYPGDGKSCNTWVVFEVKDNAYEAFSEFLDNENFVTDLSQGDLIEQLGKYKYNGKKVTDVAIGANYDSEYGGGVTASADFFGYENYFYQTEKETKYSNSFYTMVALNGLKLPYGIDFEDNLSEVFQKLDIGKDPYKNFVADADSKTDMTLYTNGDVTLVFRDLKRTDAPVEYERPYELVYSETTSAVLSDGRTKTTQRTVKLAFHDKDDNVADTLGRFEMSVVEITKKKTDKITYSGEMVIEAINLSVEAMAESQLILDLLNNGEWINDLCKCRCDYQFTLNGKELNYSSEIGAFNNITDEQYLILSDDDKVAVNEYLEKLFEHIDPSEE